MSAASDTFFLKRIVFNTQSSCLVATIEESVPIAVRTCKLYIDVDTHIPLPFTRSCINSCVEFQDDSDGSTAMHIDIRKTRLGRFAFNRILKRLGHITVRLTISDEVGATVANLLWVEGSFENKHARSVPL